MASVRGSGARVLQWLGLLLLAAVTLALCYLALTRETDDSTVDDPFVGATDTPSPTDLPSPSAAPSASSQPSDAGNVEVPEVPDQRLADFTKGDDLPDGSVVFDSPSNASAMRATAEGLTHGPVRTGETDGLGLVETELESTVRSLGFRVRFAEEGSGSAALAAWESSAVAALDGGDPLPSGLRFVAAPGAWSLAFLSGGGEQVLTGGTFEAHMGSLEFRVVRDGDQIFIVDPSGAITTATKARAGELIGPFASWGLIETDANQTPATIEAVWGG